jgi:hypothetical protein
MTFDLQKFGAPLGIAAAVIAIWYYLRGGSGVTQAIVNNPATNVPGTNPPALPGLTQQLYTIGQGGGVGGPPQAQPSIDNNIAAAKNPTSPNPTAPSYTIPAYLTYNFSPQFALSKLPAMVAMSDSAMAGKKSGCGCGGSCGGGCSEKQSCVSECDQINARYPDGRGSCFARKPPVAFARMQAANIGGYLNVTESIVPTAPILYTANG